MKAYFLPAVIFVFISASCGSSKSSGPSYVPFTADLKETLERSNVDLKKVQFYVDEKLVLTRDLGSETAQVSSGVVKLENGRYINEVIIPAFTPGIVERSAPDGLYISFEKDNNYLKFGRGTNLAGNYYTLYGRKWQNGTAEVTYQNQVYRVSCASCGHAGSAKLLVKKSQLDNWNKKTKVVEGRRVTK